MSGRYLTDLADVLRSAGLNVTELQGWQTRARSSGGYNDGGPWCVMVHHTASNGDGASDADYCTFRSSDRPVCNLVLGRDARVYVCAAGGTNTNGKGGPWTLSNGRVVSADTMNTRAIGIEMSNNGVGQAFPAVMVDAMFTMLSALANAYLGGDVALVCQHVNWAPGRKIDPATGAAVQGSWQPLTTNANGSWQLASLVTEAQRRHGATPPPPPSGGNMSTAAIVVADDALVRYFVTGADAQLYQLWWDAEASRWSEWQCLGGALADAPAAVATPGTGRIDVAAQGTDGALWRNVWDGSAWLGWDIVAAWP
jgi:hypothetical protein